MNNRKDGYYWVKYIDSWIVAEWNHTYGQWWVPGDERAKYERDMEEIKEERLKSPEE